MLALVSDNLATDVMPLILMKYVSAMFAVDMLSSAIIVILFCLN